MIECSKCGSENRFDGAVFCKNCGERLGSAVAVDLVDAPEQPTAVQPVEKTTVAADAEFTVEDVADPDDAVPGTGDRTTNEGAGIDKLLSLYGNESKVEAARSLDDPEGPERPSLGIETASDFLMRTQETTDEPTSPAAVAKSAVAPTPDESANSFAARNQEILSKLKPIADDEVDTKTAAAVLPPSAGVSDADKGQLLESLTKTFQHETPESSEVSAVRDPLTPLANSRSEVEAKAAGVPDDVVVDESVPASPESEPQLISAVAETEVPTARRSPIFLRGQKLTLPKSVNLRPGDEISLQGQEFTVKPGTIDRKTWILGGVAIGVVILILAMQSFSSPPAHPATIFGVVTNSESNEVLAGVSVSIPQLNLMTVSDEHGVFKFTGLADGRYDVKLEGELYEERYFPLVVQNGQSDIMYGSVAPILPNARTTISRPVRTEETTPNQETKSEFGVLKVNCNVAEASVYLDGKLAGKASQLLKRIRPGNRALEVRAEGYVNYAQPIGIVEGETSELAVTLQPVQSDQPVEYTAQDFFDQAEALYAEQKYTEAVGYYTLALAKDNSMVRAYVRRAEAHLESGKKLNARADYRSAADLYLNAGQYSQAITCYDKIIDFQPNASDAYGLRGWANIASGNYDSGISDLEKALTFSPEDVQAQIDVGKALYIVGRYKDSEKALKKLKKAAEDNPEIYGYLALTCLAQGDESDARKNYEQFKKRASSTVVARMSTESGWQRLTALAGN